MGKTWIIKCSNNWKHSDFWRQLSINNKAKRQVPDTWVTILPSGHSYYLILILVFLFVSGEHPWIPEDPINVTTEETIDPAEAVKYIASNFDGSCVCKICGHLSKNKGHCKTHIISRHGPDMKLQCPKCPKLLRNKFAYRTHLWAHNKEH